MAAITRVKMFMPSIFARCVEYEIIRFQTKLCGDEARHHLWDHLARLQKASRITKGTQLQCKTDLVLRAAATTYVFDVIISQSVMLQQGGFASRQVKKRCALPRRQNGSMGHVISFCVTGGAALT
jgi:hypothetical protein